MMNDVFVNSITEQEKGCRIAAALVFVCGKVCLL